MNNIPLERVNQFVDLGVTVCSSLKWDKHIENVTKKANQRLGMIKRTLGNSVNKNVKLIAYTSMVRPIVEYSSIIWSNNNNKKCLNMLESIQRRASKYILQDYSSDYKLRLMSCQLLPLSYRREYMDSVFFYNCLNDLVDINIFDIVLTNSNVNLRYVDEENIVLKHQPCNTELYMNYYPNRIVKIWNTLPSNLKSVELTASGKNIPFKKEVKQLYFMKLANSFMSENNCTWITSCRCYNCRQ
jgi:hypothetical protein